MYQKVIQKVAVAYTNNPIKPTENAVKQKYEFNIRRLFRKTEGLT
jgi:hypothetical protein